MDRERLADLLHGVQRGACSIDEALAAATLPFGDLGFARVDHHRAPAQRLPRGGARPRARRPSRSSRSPSAGGTGANVLVTRLDAGRGGACCAAVPRLDVPRRCARSPSGAERRRSAARARHRRWSSRRARPTCRWPRRRRSPPSWWATASSGSSTSASPASIACSASTSACGRARAHRRRRHGGRAAERGRRAGRRPVIAVPTSVGYGASFGGLAALLGMLNTLRRRRRRGEHRQRLRRGGRGDAHEPRLAA